MSVVRASLLGAVDGVVTSFAIVAGSFAGALSSSVVVILGFSSVLADGLSMGISEYLSTATDRTVWPAVACFASFVVCGLVPIGVYLATDGDAVACVVFVIAELMGLGVARACATGTSAVHGLVETTLLGAVAGGVAYGVGRAAASVV